MRENPTRFIVTLILAAATARAAAGEDQPPPPDVLPAPPQAAVWSEVSESERATVTQLLEAPDWPFRAFGLLRLEHYRGEEVESMLTPRLYDESWQVRCFALRQAHRLKINIASEALAGEADGRVIRAALRYGVKIDPEKVGRGAHTLLRVRSLDELMLGLELAAAGGDEKLRTEAAKRAKRLIQNMNEATAVRISRRLAVLVDVHPAPQTVAEWRQWLHDRGGNITLSESPGPNPIAGLVDHNVIAQMDAETFARLREYLDALRRRDLELVIVMDSTWSMLPMLNQVRAGVEMLILYLSDISHTMRLAFVAYRDHDNPPVWEGYRLTRDVDSIRNFLFNLSITGGVDYPEAVLDGLRACRELDFTQSADRQIVLVGDAPPHDEDLYQVASLVEESRGHGITTHAVHVPMEFPPGFVEALSPPAASRARAWLIQYNTNTRATFAEIARMGGGNSVQLTRAEELVPSIVHCTIQQPWWPAFDEFYALYLQLCR